VNSLARRVRRIEKKLGCDDDECVLRLPDPHNKGEFIEIPGCRTLLDAYAKYVHPKQLASRRAQERRDREATARTKPDEIGHLSGDYGR
jgi:hypothetical protein